MRKPSTLIAALLITLISAAQVPDRISYQAVIRNSSNQLVTNQVIGMQISIIQGTIYSGSVYVETHTPSTNANGLVTVEIGGGNPVFGSFSTIDWSGGPCFIKTETDPYGGSAYSITGISQILSVPYALHAVSADNLKGQITQSQISDLQNYLTTESDPYFNTSPAKTISTGTIADWNTAFGWGNHATAGYLTGERTIAINGSVQNLAANRTWNVGTVTSLATNNGITGGPVTGTGTIGLSGQALELHNLTGNGLITRASRGDIVTREILAGSGITVANGDGERGNPSISLKAYQVGDFIHGGIVFWVDDTGQHGLVCAKSDQSTGVRWHAGSYGNTRSYGDGPLAGKMNTAVIIAAHAALGDDGNSYGARICYELQISEAGRTFSDWHLPSKEELRLIYENRFKINTTAVANGGSSFASASYWSSTEIANGLAWSQNFTNGFQINSAKGALHRVRAVRTF